VIPAGERDTERDTALAALGSAADALRAVAAALPPEEAQIVETGALMALDPALRRGVEGAILSDGASAAAAIIRATTEHAEAIAALGDATLAARADDVRSLGRRAALLAQGCGSSAALQLPTGSDPVLVARDVGPGDVAELAPVLAGVALVGGGATAHAAIVARSLGIPMVTGVDAELLKVSDGTPLALDGTAGVVVVEPTARRASVAAQRMRSRRDAAELERSQHATPAVTADGRRITVLANVASPPELKLALDAGAEGIGLLRTELAFLEWNGWPEEQDHTDALSLILSGLGDLRAVVRALDFGADKAPPFLRGVTARGLELLLANSDAFLRQLRAILLCARGRQVSILLPMVDEPIQIARSHALLERAARELGIQRTPDLGAMVETPLAAANAREIAEVSDFLSIGTNDLTASTLGADRFEANEARAHDPRVLRLIAQTVDAARDEGIPIEVCGEAASDPLMLPLLVGLGVSELSVGAAQVGAVRRWIRRLTARDADRLAQSTLAMDSAEEVERAIRPLAAELQGTEPGNLVHAVGA
jgi:phosphoenolpyruvate-protein kinase (PTS system EI component)